MSNQVSVKSSKTHPTVLGLAIGLVMKIIAVSITAWFVLVVWLFIQWYFKDQNTVLQSLQVIIDNNAQFIQKSHSFLANQGIAWLYKVHHLLSAAFNYVERTKLDVVESAAQVVLAATEVNLSRLIILVLALPLLFLLLLVFATDGLVQRDIRKFQGARESTFLFHRSQYLLRFCIYAPLFIYLCVPIAVTPVLFIMTQGILMGLVVMLSATYYKKYV